MSEQINPGAVARAEGRPRYVGRLCKRHPSGGGERFARNNHCVLCVAEDKRKPAALERARRADTARRQKKQSADAAFQARQAARAERRAEAEAHKAAVAERKKARELRRLIGGPSKKVVRRARAQRERDFAFLAARSLMRHPAPRANRAELQALWDRQRGLCGLTGVPIGDERPHLDHIVPVAEGGTSTIDNLHFTHPLANMAKNSHSVEYFRTWLLAAAESLKAKMALEELF